MASWMLGIGSRSLPSTVAEMDLEDQETKASNFEV